jgi:hypothetical protein
VTPIIVLALIIRIIAPDLGDSEARISVLLTAGLVGSVLFNFVYGAFLGLLAAIFKKIF